jgi:hypothetical protein
MTNSVRRNRRLKQRENVTTVPLSAKSMLQKATKAGPNGYNICHINAICQAESTIRTQPWHVTMRGGEATFQVEAQVALGVGTGPVV